MFSMENTETQRKVAENQRMNTERSIVSQKRKNEKIYTVRYICMATSFQLNSGAFAAAFMLYIGLNTEKISIVNLAMNLGLLFASVLVVFAYNIDRTGLGIIKTGSVLGVLIPFSLLASSYLYKNNFQLAYLLLIVFSFIGYTAFSMRNSAEINAVPMLFGRERYALLTGRCGYLGGIVTLLISLSTIFLFKSSQDIGHYRIFFLISSVLSLLYGILALLFKRPDKKKTAEQFHIDFKLLYKKKYLIAGLPHFTRGIGAAALTLWPATIMSHFKITIVMSSMLIPVAITAGIIGSYLFLKISRVMKPGTMTMIGYLASAVFLFLTPVINTVPFFFVCFFLYNLIVNAFCMALMNAFVYSCNKEELALVSSFHILYYALAFCPAVIIIGKIIDQYTFQTMLVTGVIYCASGVMMHFFFRRSVPDSEQAA